MSLEKAVATKRLLEICALISQRQKEENFDAILELTTSALQNPDFDFPEAQGRLLYHKAVALDLSGHSDVALEVLAGLVQAFPGAPDVEQSLRVVCRGMEQRARMILDNAPDSKELLGINLQLEKYGVPPFWLINYVANHELGQGQTAKAWSRIKALLALSPNDADYLRCAISIAKAGGLQAERNTLLIHVANLWEARPCRLELAVLLVEEGVRLEAAQSS